MATGSRAVRDVADAYVTALAGINPLIATRLGLPVGQDELPDLSPGGRAAADDLSRATLAELDRVENAAPGPRGDVERRCGRLLRERLDAELRISADDEYLREVVNIFGLRDRVQGIFIMMPTDSAQDWESVAKRMRRLPDMLAGHRSTLSAALANGRFTAAPNQVRIAADQLDELSRDNDERGWYAGFCAGAEVSASLRSELARAAGVATDAVAELRDWLRADYLPDVAATPDGVGADRFHVWARYWTGAELDLHETYAWGWEEYRGILAQMRAEADRVLPGAPVRAAMRHLDEHGEAVEGVEELRVLLQRWMDEVIDELDGTHFELAPPVRVVEARIAPAGSAASAYYTEPSKDFSRPGRAWMPVHGRTRFPLWTLRSVWYHEGVPGHHLQLAQWRYLADQLSEYQTGVGAGSVDACMEGWALYAERLMDELGYLRSPGERLGFLDWQMLRAIRVVIDIGAHLDLDLPADSPIGAGESWTPALAREFLSLHSGQTNEFVGTEIGRYLGLPGQAISYKLGERAWLAGREAARAARGTRFDPKSWHMAALSLGSLGLDDLQDELARL